MLVIACGGPHDVTVEVRLPDLASVERPVPGLPIILLPYDRDSLLDVLEAQAPAPRPHVSALDSLFEAFRGPYLEIARAAHFVERYRDSLTVLRAALDTLDRADEAYHTRFQLFAQLRDSLTRSERRRESAAVELRRARESFVPLTDSLRMEVRLWEDSTFRGYDSVVNNLVEDTGRQGLTDTTSVDGRVAMRIGRGAWWVYARAWDVEDPNSEWYWNILIKTDTVVLNSGNGMRLPTY